MGKSSNEILAAELQKLAAKAAKDETGASVVGWVAKKLRDDTYQIQMQTPAAPEAALRTAHAVLQEKGQLREDVPSPCDIAALTAVVGSGFLGLNPALVTVQVTARADHLTDIQITGIAKEGLIKQHAGEKAAKLIATQLAERLPPVPA